MSRDRLDSDIQFVLVPHGNEADSPSDEMIPILLNRFEKPVRIFYISHMADNPELTAFRSETDESTFVIPEDLAQPFTTNALGPKISSAVERRLPIVEVKTTLLGRANDPNPAENIAISSGKLVEWLRRTSRLLGED